MGFQWNESTGEWVERAIVANSVAAYQEEALAEAGNPTAIRVARQRAAEAAADLWEALDALRAQRRRTAG